MTPSKSELIPIAAAFVALGLLVANPFAVAAEPARAELGSTNREALWVIPDKRRLRLKSKTALVIDHAHDRIVYAKNADESAPIASITKLMSALVILDAQLPGDEAITIVRADKDRLKYARSRLPVGTVLTRDELLHLALVASENRAASALARTYPGGSGRFVAAMNEKAQALGMAHTRFVEPTGLSWENVSTAHDLALMMRAAYGYGELRRITTLASFTINSPGRLKGKEFKNTNLLVRKPRPAWQVGLSKTGYILESGRCLVMQARVNDRELLIILLNSWGKYTSVGDSNRIRKWLEIGSTAAVDRPETITVARALDP